MTEAADGRYPQVTHSNPATQAGFTMVPNAVLLRRDLSPVAKLIYAYLKHLAWRNGDGPVGQTRDQIGADLGIGEKTVGRHLNELAKATTIEGDPDAPPLVEPRRRGLGLSNLYVINDPGMPAPGTDPGKVKSAVQDPSDRPDLTRARSFSEVRHTTLDRPPPTPPPANRPAKVDRKPVTHREYAVASAVLDGFNRLAKTRYGSRDYIAKIVMRLREHPDLPIAAHEEIIRVALDSPWWAGDASPSVIYGNASLFERCMHAAAKKLVGGPGATMTADEAETYGVEWGPGTPHATPGQARAARGAIGG